MATDLWREAVLIHRTPIVPLSSFLPADSLLTALVRPFLPNFLALPRQWFYVLLNAVTQYVCISGVHQLTTVTTSLTVNLAFAIRIFPNPNIRLCLDKFG